MKPSQTLDMHADLLSRFDDRRFQNLVAAQYRHDIGPGPTADRADPYMLDRAAQGLTSALYTHVKNASTYHVTEDMSVMVQHAAAGLDETDTFDISIPPTAHGIVRFDRPLEIRDVRGRTMLGHWMVWGRTQVNGETRLIMSWFNDADEPDDVARMHAEVDPYSWAKVREFSGRWSWIGGDFAIHGAELGTPEKEPDAGQAAQVAAEGDTPHPATSTVRYATALWMLLGQTITSVSDADLDRPTRRRAGKANLPPRVTVIAMRRSEGAARAEGESLVEWAHRWIVRGHWRWVTRGPRSADHDHVFAPVGTTRSCLHEGCENVMDRIWVRPHQKGPEDKPLVVSDKVYDLRQ